MGTFKRDQYKEDSLETPQRNRDEIIWSSRLRDMSRRHWI